MCRKKLIVTFAGPNGSGKSSIISQAMKSNSVPGLYICPDNVVKSAPIECE